MKTALQARQRHRAWLLFVMKGAIGNLHKTHRKGQAELTKADLAVINYAMTALISSVEHPRITMERDAKSRVGKKRGAP